MNQLKKSKNFVLFWSMENLKPGTETVKRKLVTVIFDFYFSKLKNDGRILTFKNKS